MQSNILSWTPINREWLEVQKSLFYSGETEHTSAFLNTDIHLKLLAAGINKMERSKEITRGYIGPKMGSKGADDLKNIKSKQQ